jgi:hypothetical protein
MTRLDTLEVSNWSISSIEEGWIGSELTVTVESTEKNAKFVESIRA